MLMCFALHNWQWLITKFSGSHCIHKTLFEKIYIFSFKITWFKLRVHLIHTFSWLKLPVLPLFLGCNHFFHTNLAVATDYFCTSSWGGAKVAKVALLTNLRQNKKSFKLKHKQTHPSAMLIFFILFSGSCNDLCNIMSADIFNYSNLWWQREYFH